MTPATITFVAALIFLAALLYSSVGHAGASAYIAAMALAGVEPAVMKPTALCLNILVATIVSVQFARAGHFSWPLLWPFAVASVPAAFVGGAWTLPGYYYKPLAGAVLLVAAVRLIVGNVPLADRETKAPPLPIALLAGAGIGLVSGLTGTGGGILLTPLMLFMGWATTRTAAGVSAAFILVNSLAGLAGLASSWQEIPPTIPWWAIAAISGGLIGSHLGSRRLATPTLRRLLGVVLVIAGVKMLAVWS